MAVVLDRAPQRHSKALKKKFWLGRDVGSACLPRGVAAPRHDREAPAAGRALPASIRILYSVCRHETGRILVL